MCASGLESGLAIVERRADEGARHLSELVECGCTENERGVEKKRVSATGEATGALEKFASVETSHGFITTRVAGGHGRKEARKRG